MVAQFFYVGTQVATWSTFIPYMKAYTSVSERTAGYYLTGKPGGAGDWACGFDVADAVCGAGAATGRVLDDLNVLLLAFAVARPSMLGSWALVATSLSSCRSCFRRSLRSA